MDNSTETRLIARAWVEPIQFACDADRLGLHVDDFADRMLGTVAGYLRIVGESGQTPTPAGAEAMLSEWAVPHDPDEVFWILYDTPFPRGESFADLIMDVQRAAYDRGEAEFRALGRDALRAWKEAFERVRGTNAPSSNPYTRPGPRQLHRRLTRRRFDWNGSEVVRAK